MSFTIGSLFDGSGGFPLAGTMCGGTPVWASEIEPYPIAVTKSRFPNMKHLGSVTDVRGAEVKPVDVITFGSPCQDLSVAGKRAGLKHEDNGDEETTRSGLFMEAVRIIKEMWEATNGEYPKYAVWENVPGAFSSNRGEDFRIVLEELIKIVEPSAVMPPVPKNGWAYADYYLGDGWSLAYRVFDAQYWGVPQRRRRIYLVLDLTGQRARKILFERQGLRGYFETGRTPWQGTAGNAENRSGADDCERGCVDGFLCGRKLPQRKAESMGWTTTDVIGTLHNGTCPGFQNAVICFEPGIAKRDGADNRFSENICSTLRANMGDNQPAVCLPFDTTQITSPMNYSRPKYGDPCHPLAAGAHPPAVVCKSYDIGEARLRTPNEYTEVSPTITARCGTGGNIVPAVIRCYDARGNGEGEVVNTLTGDHQNRVTDYTALVVDPIPIHDQATRFSGKRGDNYDGKGNVLGVGDSGDPMNTLTGGDRHAVCYGIGNGQTNQSFSENRVGALNCMHDQQAVAYGVDLRNFSESPELYQTLQAKPNGGQSLNYSGAVRQQYIVRRLTPTECARLQGFPDDWGHPDKKDSLTDEEYRFWYIVRNTHAVCNGKDVKDYSRQQILSWYNKLHTDSSEYKMWGNGIALPNALYVMQGIVEAITA